MITLQDFIAMSMDDYYKINVFNTNNGNEILHQVEVGEIENELEKLDMVDYLGYEICSWDICEENNNEFTVNIC